MTQALTIQTAVIQTSALATIATADTTAKRSMYNVSLIKYFWMVGCTVADVHAAAMSGGGVGGGGMSLSLVFCIHHFDKDIFLLLVTNHSQ